MTRYWIGVASSSHVEKGVAGGFAQLGHGKAAPVQRLGVGDWIAYYSPTTALDGGEPVRAFTAIGEIAPGETYQVTLAAGFEPHRRDVVYRKSAHSAPIAPLLERLEFTRGRDRHWGMTFRRSAFEISRGDFGRIAEAMGVEFSA